MVIEFKATLIDTILSSIKWGAKDEQVNHYEQFVSDLSSCVGDVKHFVKDVYHVYNFNGSEIISHKDNITRLIGSLSMLTNTLKKSAWRYRVKSEIEQLEEVLDELEELYLDIITFKEVDKNCPTINEIMTKLDSI